MKGDSAVKQLELTFSQVMTINCLFKLGGSATLKELETRLDISHASMSGLVKRLAEKGVVNVSVGREDRRQRIVELTEKGLEMRSLIERGVEENEAILTKSLSEEETQELVRLLLKLCGNLKIEKEHETELNDKKPCCKSKRI